MKSTFAMMLEARPIRGEQAVWYNPDTYEWVSTGNDHDTMVENDPEKFGLTADELNWSPSSNVKYQNPKYFAIENGWARVDIFQKFVHIELDHLNGKIKDSLSHLAEKLSMRYIPGTREVTILVLDQNRKYDGIVDDLFTTVIFESKLNEETSDQIAKCAEEWWTWSDLGSATDYNWERVRNYPLRLLGDKESWVQWYKEEKAMWAADGDSNRFDSLEKYWKSNPDDPIFVVKPKAGDPIVIDGNHRVGISCTNGKTTIDAYVGTHKSLTESREQYFTIQYWIGPDGAVYDASDGHEEFMGIDSEDINDASEQMNKIVNSGWIRVTGDSYAIFIVSPPWSKKIANRIFDFLREYVGISKKLTLSIETTKGRLDGGPMLEVLSGDLFTK